MNTSKRASFVQPSSTWPSSHSPCTILVWLEAHRESRPIPDSEQFRSAPKVPHASMRKHLRCQRATSRAFGDKRLFREVSKTGALEIPVGLPLEARVRVA